MVLQPNSSKLHPPAISAPLSGIINHIFDQSKCPTKAKAAEVGPIYKKDSQLDKNNYRPVSVLTILSKHFEISMNQQLSQFYDVVLSDLMSAYRKGYSCQYSLIKLLEDLRTALEDLLLMALSKVFDCLQHDLLAAKLSAYGMCPDAVRLLIIYLRCRKQRLKFGENSVNG